MRIIAKYNQSLKKYPNPPGVSLTGTDSGEQGDPHVQKPTPQIEGQP